MRAGEFQAGHISSKEEVRALVSIRGPHKDEEENILDMLVSSGALLKGHFLLESGQHSSHFLRFDYVATSRKNIEFIADCLIADLRRDRVSFDAVVVQEHAGRFLGETIGDKLGKRTLVIETDAQNRPTGEIINESALYPGDKVLVVVDMTTTGAGLRHMTSALRLKNAVPVAIALFAARSKQQVSKLEREEGLKVYALIDIAFEEKTRAPEQCEVCEGGKVPVPSIKSWDT